MEESKNRKIKTCAYCTLGCKVNSYDTDAMRAVMEESGYITVPFSDIADVYVINTCSVTHISDRKSRQMISRAHTKNPDAIIIVAGCYAKTAPEVVSALPGVNIVLGTNDRKKVADILNSYIAENRNHALTYTADDTAFEELSADESDKTRAYLKIQDGCNRFCSYCIIPYARGRIRSRSLESTKNELLRLAEKGYKEVVLTGIHLMSYGLDLDGVDIVDAIALSKDIDGIKRVRLGSLDPDFITDKFVKAVSENKKVCRQFHLSLQSGSNTVLKRMNRRYTAEQYKDAVMRLRRAMPDCAITTDIIAGFAGETDLEHEETLKFVDEIGFARVHVFPYSERRGTVAAKMPDQVSPEIKEKRAHEIAKAAEMTQKQYMQSFIGRRVEVLFEEAQGEFLRGYTDTYIDVLAKAGAELVNEIKSVEVKEAYGTHLVGDIAED